MSKIDYNLLGHAVQNGEIKYLSVSSVTKFDPESVGGCPRRWWFHYVEGDKEEATKAQALGTQIHAEIANYLKTGKQALGPMAMEALPLLPAPSPDLMVEHQIATQDGPKLSSILNANGVPFVGDIDLLYTDGARVIVADHKTTAKKPDELPDGESIANTVQMTGYGIAALEYYDTPSVVLAHNYIGTKKRYAEQKSAVRTPEQINGRWNTKVVPLVGQMQHVASETDVQKVPKNTDSCHAWHRTCKYATKCFVDPIEQLIVIGNPKERTVGLNILDALKAKNVSATPAPKTLPPPGGMSKEGPFYTPQQQDLLNVDAQGNSKVLPPDAAPSSPATFAEPPPAGEPIPPGVEEKIAVIAPKKRGRPAKNPAPTPMESSPAQSAPPAQTVAPGDTVAPSVGAQGGVIIAVDCIAPGVQSLSGYVSALVEKLTTTANVLDVRTIRDKDSPLAFGGWRGVLAALAKKDPPASGVYAVASNEFVDAILEGLESGAVIIRGRR